MKISQYVGHVEIYCSVIAKDEELIRLPTYIANQ